MHYLVMKEVGHATEATKLSQNNHSIRIRMQLIAPIIICIQKFD